MGSVWRARLRTATARGISFSLPTVLNPGDKVEVELPGVERGTSLLVSVVKAVRGPDGQWLIGGVFERPLTADELRALAGP